MERGPALAKADVILRSSSHNALMRTHKYSVLNGFPASVSFDPNGSPLRMYFMVDQSIDKCKARLDCTYTWLVRDYRAIMSAGRHPGAPPQQGNFCCRSRLPVLPVSTRDHRAVIKTQRKSEKS